MARTCSILIVLFLVAGARGQAFVPAEPGADLRVQVDLKNGSSIVGIAPHGVLVEKAARSGYEAAHDPAESRSGIRIWYYRNLDGFLFLPYKTVQELKVLNPLTPEESKILRDAAARARKGEASAGPAKDDKDASGARGELSADEASLLAQFPPDRGWSAERYGEIQRRKIVNDLQPTGDEARFVEVYAEWEKAWRKQRASGGSSPRAEKPAEPRKPAAGKKPAEPPAPPQRREGLAPGGD